MDLKYELNKEDYIRNRKIRLKRRLLRNLREKLIYWLFEHIMYINFRRKDINNFSVYLNEEYIGAVSDLYEISIRWEAIKRIKIKPNIITVEYGLNKKLEILMESSAFEKEEYKEQFINVLKNKILKENNYPIKFNIPENAYLTIKFTYSIEDDEYFYKYERECNKAGKLISSIARYTLLGSITILCIIAYQKENLALIILLIFSTSLYLYFIKKKHLKNIVKEYERLLLKNSDKYSPSSEKNVVLSEEGIYFQDNNAVIFIKYEKMNNFNIIESENYIGILSIDSVIFWIPVGVFKNYDEKKEFLKKINCFKSCTNNI